MRNGSVESTQFISRISSKDCLLLQVWSHFNNLFLFYKNYCYHSIFQIGRLWFLSYWTTTLSIRTQRMESCPRWNLVTQYRISVVFSTQHVAAHLTFILLFIYLQDTIKILLTITRICWYLTRIWRNSSRRFWSETIKQYSNNFRSSLRQYNTKMYNSPVTHSTSVLLSSTQYCSLLFCSLWSNLMRSAQANEGVRNWICCIFEINISIDKSWDILIVN